MLSPDSYTDLSQACGSVKRSQPLGAGGLHPTGNRNDNFAWICKKYLISDAKCHFPEFGSKKLPFCVSLVEQSFVLTVTLSLADRTKP